MPDPDQESAPARTPHQKRSGLAVSASKRTFGSLDPRRWSWLIALATAGLLAVLASIFVQRPPASTMPAAPTHYLDDQAGLVSPEFAAAKDQYIEYLSRTMRIAQINVVILPGIPSGELEEFTIGAATAWKLGAGNVDNGLVLFIFRDDRKLRLEVGYGLEPVITDAVAHRLMAEQLVPAFARGQFETGIEDFLDELNKTLESSEAASHRAAPYAAMIPFVLNVLRNSPRFDLHIWHTFLAADTEGRIVLSLFGLVLAALLAAALIGIAAGVPAILMLPWRLYSSQSLRTIRTATVMEQFSPKKFFARPPPFLTSLFSELQGAAILNSIYLLIAIVVGIAFLFVGSSILIGGLGHYGGAGASLSWPAS
jgi:uncharacterized protein